MVDIHLTVNLAPWILHSFLRIIQFESSEVYVDLPDDFNASVVRWLLGECLLCSQFDQILWVRRERREVLGMGRSPVGGRRHEICEEFLVGIFGSGSLLSLFIKLLLHEWEELVDWNIPEVSVVALEEPLEHFLVGILLPLLICHVVGESRLLVKLGQGVRCLFEAILQTI